MDYIPYLLLFILLMVVLDLLFILPTRWLKVERVHHPIGLKRKVLQISDIHIERNRIKEYVIRSLIEREKPDLICLTGDFLDQEEALSDLVPYLAVIRDSGIPTYAVLGNHDYRLPDIGQLLKLLRTHAITVLRNESVAFDDFTLVGIDDFGTSHHHPAAAMKKADPHKPIFVITHDPNVALAMPRRYDYMIAGHLHGKQCNIPFLYHLLSMGELPKQGIYRGVHRMDTGTLYISKGIGQTGLNLRFLVRSEVTVHEL
jgi:predicted MPP superfamily phosphohydrolase